MTKTRGMFVLIAYLSLSGPAIAQTVDTNITIVSAETVLQGCWADNRQAIDCDGVRIEPIPVTPEWQNNFTVEATNDEQAPEVITEQK